jgi:hypothetical protein
MACNHVGVSRLGNTYDQPTWQNPTTSAIDKFVKMFSHSAGQGSRCGWKIANVQNSYSMTSTDRQGRVQPCSFYMSIRSMLSETVKCIRRNAPFLLSLCGDRGDIFCVHFPFTSDSSSDVSQNPTFSNITGHITRAIA